MNALSRESAVPDRPAARPSEFHANFGPSSRPVQATVREWGKCNVNRANGGHALMGEDVSLFPARKIEFRPRWEKVETGLGQMGAPFAGQHRIQRGLQGMQMGDIAGGIG